MGNTVWAGSHMFSYFDCDDFKVISLKCQPELIEELKAKYTQRKKNISLP